MTVREATPADVETPRRLIRSEDVAIRWLERRDVEGVIAIGRLEWPNQFPGDIFDEAHMRAILMCHFDSETFGAWVLVNDDQIVLGFLGLCLSPVMMTKKLVAEDTWWYVHPAVRGRQGLQLVKIGEQWAKTKGAALIHLGIHHEKYRPILERMRYNLATLTFEKAL